MSRSTHVVLAAALFVLGVVGIVLYLTVENNGLQAAACIPMFGGMVASGVVFRSRPSA